jgi:hypothetical protein
MFRTTLALLVAAGGLAIVTAATAMPTLDDIQKLESTGTDFRGLAAGEQVPPKAMPGVVFSAPGSVVFLQNGDYYLSGSNRAWGFSGRKTATIEFKEPAASVTIIGRGSSKADMTGPAVGGEQLEDAEAFVHAISVDGRRLASEKLLNSSVRGDDTRVITFSGIGPIKSIQLQNRVDAKRSMAVIAGIGVTKAGRCSADITGVGNTADGNVDALDFLALVAQFGSSCKTGCSADITGPKDVPDDRVDALDFLALIGQFGSPATCPQR